ncbi:MAG: hypothetical protein ACLFTK_05360 [Anaerolineales bacterium]
MKHLYDPKFAGMVLLCCVLIVGPVLAQAPPPAPDDYLVPPRERDYSQAGIDALMNTITEQYGIGFAFPVEWIANDAREVMWFTDGLHHVLGALYLAAYYLHAYDGAPEDISPAEHFRQHFDRANILLDRVLGIENGFDGNTMPVVEDSQIVSYNIQLAPGGLSGQYVMIHELAHVLDALLNDTPQADFVTVLGGEMTPIAWRPGAGYVGNEILFPRAVAGANEDFADTFAAMLMGRLSPENVAVRYDFMRAYLPIWLAAIRGLPEDIRDLHLPDEGY